MQKCFIGVVLSSIPFQHIAQLILQCFEAAFAREIVWHVGVFPNEDEMERGQLRVSFDDIACNGTRKGMPICLLYFRELFDQPLSLPSTNRYLELGHEYLASGIIDPPRGWRGAGTARGIELELPDILLSQQEDTTGFVGREAPEIDIAVHPFICDP